MVASARSSQVVEESLTSTSGASRASQVVEEALSRDTSNARASQVVLVVLSSLSSFGRASQVAEEVLTTVFTFPNPIPVFPQPVPGFGYSVHKRPTFATIVQTATSGREVTSAQQAYPLWEFELTYEALREQTQNQVIDSYMAPNIELEKIAGLFLACNGQYGRFYFEDISDNSRAGQFIGTGDGHTTSFRVVRTFGVGTNTSLTEPVGGVNTNHPVQLYQDGTPQVGTAYQVSADGLSIECIGGYIPPPGSVLTLDFFFYYFCRFIEDVHDYEQFLHNLWTLKALKFRSVKV